MSEVSIGAGVLAVVIEGGWTVVGRSVSLSSRMKRIALPYHGNVGHVHTGHNILNSEVLTWQLTVPVECNQRSI